jgi:hypothetical protein
MDASYNRFSKHEIRGLFRGYQAVLDCLVDSLNRLIVLMAVAGLIVAERIERGSSSMGIT